MKLYSACIALLAVSSAYANNEKKRRPRANGKVRNRRLRNNNRNGNRNRTARGMMNGYGKQQAVAENEINTVDRNSDAYLEAKARDAGVQYVRGKASKSITQNMDSLAGFDYKASNARPDNMDHESAEYLNFKSQAVLQTASLNEDNTLTVKMPDGKTFVIEEDDPTDERGIPTRGENLGVETIVKMQDGKTFIFEEDDMDERGAVPPAGYDPRSMDHNSAEYVNFKMQAVKVEGPPQIEAETVVKMQDGKTFIFEEDDMDERGAETVVKTQDGKTFIFEEDDMDERGAVPPAGYDPRSMDHNSAEYINLKMQALEERDTPVHPLPNAKTVSMRPIAQAEDLPAEFEEDEDIFAEADLAMEQMDELREQDRAEELKRLEHQFAEFEADYAAFEEEYGASEENIFSGAN